MDYINIGPTPYDENCAQVGQEGYYIRARKECAAYCRQLRRMYPEKRVQAGALKIEIRAEAGAALAQLKGLPDVSMATEISRAGTGSPSRWWRCPERIFGERWTS